MAADLAAHINELRVIDTHEHMFREDAYLADGPRDVLADLFSNYGQSDLIVAGASAQAVEALMHGSLDDAEQRWAAVADAWQAIRFTGYGEAVRLAAKHVYGIDEINAETARAAQPALDAIKQPGGRLALLRDTARLDHIQTDDKLWSCEPDASGPDFFLYDLSWVAFCGRGLDFAELASETGVTVTTLNHLREAMARIFQMHAATAIAVKSQHAYNRTLRWVERSDADAERALQFILQHPDQWDTAEGLCLSDWGLARGVEHCIEHNLPFKLHTGYYAGAGRMPIDRLRAGHLCPLLMRYPQAKFVLMHIAYPYCDEIVALAKHFPNVWVDMCWAWSIDPFSAGDFVRRFIHAAPINKLFAFGGDINFPTSAYAYALQMRHGLTNALQAEVEGGALTQHHAIEIASRVLRENQLACFDVEGTRLAIGRAMSEASA